MSDLVLPPFPFALPKPPAGEAGLDAHIAWFRSYADKEIAVCPHDPAPLELKLFHTMRVVDNARAICAGENLPDERVCMLAALYHDVGRFAQYRVWKTFKDKESVNHGLLSSTVLEKCQVLRNEPEIAEDVIAAVRWHNAFRLPEGMEHNVAALVVRDADKLDILRVIDGHLSSEGPYEPTVILSLPDDRRGFSQTVLDCALRGVTASYTDLTTVNDFRLLLGTWIDGLNFATSRRMMAEQGHVERLLAPLPEDIFGKAKKTLLQRLKKYAAQEHNDKTQ